jgi:hypothetical protein
MVLPEAQPTNAAETSSANSRGIIVAPSSIVGGVAWIRITYLSIPCSASGRNPDLRVIVLTIIPLRALSDGAPYLPFRSTFP